MELKLNIYNKKEIKKTYTAEAYELLFGTVEDFINIIDLDKLENGTDAEIIKLVGNMIIKGGLEVIKPLLKDIFDGLTDEELRNVKVSEISKVLVEVVKFAISQMNLGTKGKN